LRPSRSEIAPTNGASSATASNGSVTVSVVRASGTSKALASEGRIAWVAYMLR